MAESPDNQSQMDQLGKEKPQEQNMPEDTPSTMSSETSTEPSETEGTKENQNMPEKNVQPANMSDSLKSQSQMDHLGKGKPQEQKTPEKEVFVLSGEKCYILLIGKTLKSHEDFIVQLKKIVPGLQEVKTVDDCDFILVFCPVVSRAGTDIEKAVKNINDTSATKPAVLVVLHHTFDPDYCAPESSRAVKRQNTITVDCLFYEDQGLLTCKRNYNVITHLKMQMKIQKTGWWNNRKPNSSDTSSSTKPGATSRSQSDQKPHEYKDAENIQHEEIKKLEEFQKNILAREEKECVYKANMAESPDNQSQMDQLGKEKPQEQKMPEDTPSTMSSETSTEPSEIEGTKENQNMPEKNVQPGATSRSQSDQMPHEYKDAEFILRKEIKQLEEFQKDILASEEKECVYKEVIIATELNLVLLARTESDKTAAKNIILGKEVAATSTTTSTPENQNTQLVAGRKVTVVDTPDWFSPGASLEEFRHTEGPHAFLLIIPVMNSEHKKDETQVTCLKMQEIIRERWWKNTMIIFSVTDVHQKKNIEEFIQSGEKELQGLLEKCNNKFHCLNMKERGAGSQVSELLEKIEEMVEGRGTKIYQIITDIESERLKKNTLIKDVQFQMQKTLDKFEEYTKDFKKDLRDLSPDQNGEYNRNVIIALKNKRELQREVGEEIKKRYDTIVKMEENRQFIKVILPETMETVWLSLPDEPNKNFDKKNELAQLEEWFSANVGKLPSHKVDTDL